MLLAITTFPVVRQVRDHPRHGTNEAGQSKRLHHIEDHSNSLTSTPIAFANRLCYVKGSGYVEDEPDTEIGRVTESVSRPTGK
jgi:hypothetical protein